MDQEGEREKNNMLYSCIMGHECKRPKPVSDSENTSCYQKVNNIFPSAEIVLIMTKYCIIHNPDLIYTHLLAQMYS